MPSGYISSGHRHGRQVERRSNLKGRFLGNWRAKKGFLASLPFCTDLKSTTQNIRKPISVQPENQFSGTHPTMTVTLTFQSKVTGPIHPAHISWKCVLLAFFTSGHSAQLMTPQAEISILGSRKIVKSRPEMCDLSKPRDHETALIREK